MTFTNIKFTKMHGLGNDFIIFDYLDNKQNIISEEWSNFARSICCRGFGIGADGIVILSGESENPSMTIFNPDGSEAEMCGNAVRCVAKYIQEMGKTNQENLSIHTKAGTKNLSLTLKDNQVTSICVNMGKPILDSNLIPVKGKSRKVIREQIDTPVGKITFTSVSMGNPHTVVFTDSEHEQLVTEIGPYLEKHTYFSSGTNVEFVTVKSVSEIVVSVWERSVGRTYACGTGACAALVAAVINNYTYPEVKVELPGGNLNIKWNRDSDNCVYMAGEAQFVYSGTLLMPFQ